MRRSKAAFTASALRSTTVGGCGTTSDRRVEGSAGRAEALYPAPNLEGTSVRRLSAAFYEQSPCPNGCAYDYATVIGGAVQRCYGKSWSAGSVTSTCTTTRSAPGGRC